MVQVTDKWSELTFCDGVRENVWEIWETLREIKGKFRCGNLDENF